MILGKQGIYLCICNEILNYSDLIGRYEPNNFHNSLGLLIVQKNGFVIEGNRKGKCIILD